jgi:hypothetical protein
VSLLCGLWTIEGADAVNLVQTRERMRLFGIAPSIAADKSFCMGRGVDTLWDWFLAHAYGKTYLPQY